MLELFTPYHFFVLGCTLFAIAAATVAWRRNEEDARRHGIEIEKREAERDRTATQQRGGSTLRAPGGAK